MSCHLECVFTHIFFGGLLFVMGIVDLLFSYDYGDFWTGLRFFVIFCGVWMYITGVILARNRKRSSSRRKAFAGAFITSSLCGMTVGACYSFLILYFCEFSCHCLVDQRMLLQLLSAYLALFSVLQDAVVVTVLPFLLVRDECFTGKCTTRKIHKNYIRDPSALFSIISHADQILSPANVPAGDAQMVPTCMPPRSAFQNNDRPPPYGDGSPGPDLLLVPLEGTSVVQQNDRPPPYTVDAQTCSHGSDLLLVPLEMTPMPPQETGPPPPYHQISTTESVMSSFHDGHQPPPYVCTDEQHRVTTYV